jgi:hypothetical protein
VGETVRLNVGKALSRRHLKMTETIVVENIAKRFEKMEAVFHHPAF